MKYATTLLGAALALALAACGGNNDGTAGETVGTGMTAGDTAAGTGPANVGSDASTMGAADTTTAGQPAEGDRKALAAVQEVDRHEIAAAEDALAKNVEGDVRSYAETLRDDHTRNLEATRRLMGDSAMAGMSGAHTGAGSTAAGTGMTGAGNTAGGDGMTGTGATGTGAMGTTATDAMAGAGMADDAELRAMREKHDAERTRLAALEGEAFTTAWIAAMVQGHEEALAKLDNELIPNASDAAVSRHLETTRTAIAGHLETARSLQSANR